MEKGKTVMQKIAKFVWDLMPDNGTKNLINKIEQYITFSMPSPFEGKNGNINFSNFSVDLDDPEFKGANFLKVYEIYSEHKTALIVWNDVPDPGAAFPGKSNGKFHFTKKGGNLKIIQ